MSSIEPQERKRLSLTAWIAIGLVAGLFCGLFFGEYTSRLKWLGDAFIGLLQMAVIPYVAVSLIGNVGRLSVNNSIRLLRASVFVLGLLWMVGLLSLLIVSQAFPEWDTGSFFCSRFTEEPPAPNWMDLFIPSNPFRSLADNSIPAIVVFSIGLGIALMSVPNKEKLLAPLEVLTNALAVLNKLVVKLTPIGMFAIVAYTAGTVDPDQFRLIQGYLIIYALAAIIISFVVLPALIASLTTIPFRDVVSVSRDPMMAAFVIGNSFVVLPIIIASIERLKLERDFIGEGDSHQASYLVPLGYPFPDIGRIVGLVFIPFAAWFYGQTIDSSIQPQLLGVGLLGSFGKPVITLPLLLNIAELPSDIFNLFLASGVIAARFGDLMKTMHLIAFTLLTTAILSGRIRFQPKQFAIAFVGATLTLIIATGLVRGYLSYKFQDEYSKEKLITQREMIFPDETKAAQVETVILEQSMPNSLPIAEGQTRVERIKAYGKIRVGFTPNRMPFSYFRGGSKVLIGFDIQMAYYLASDLGVGIEFVPIQETNLREELYNDHYDVAMSALEGTIERAALIPSMDSYMDVTLAVVVPDHDKARFRDLPSVMNIADLTFAAVKGSYFAERAKQLSDELNLIEIDSPEEYFFDKHREVDGLVISAEAGSAWTIRHPRFSVANPLKGRVRVPLYYLTSDDLEFETFLQNWLALKKASGVYNELYDYWILGLDNSEKAPRWSIIRNVLGWVE